MAHPGGLLLTKEAIGKCLLPEKAAVLDVGCGSGYTAAFLTSEHGCIVTGIDKSAKAISIAKKKHKDISFLRGDGQFLDFESRSFDCVLMECSLSLLSNPVEAVHEAYCVLASGGYLIIHDLYLPDPVKTDLEAVKESEDKSKSPKAEGSCGAEILSPYVVDGALVLSGINSVIEELGFEVVSFEDKKKDLEIYAASMLLNGESSDCYPKTTQGGSKYSYFLMVLRKC